MINKKFALKFISFIMSFLMLISYNSASIPIFISYAGETDYTVSQSETDAKNDKKQILIAGWWSEPENDGLVPPYNYFHNQVQKHIRDNYEGIKENEMTFDDKTRADLFKIKTNDRSENIAYFWEVKPGSFLEPSKMKEAKTQLGNYLTKEPLNNIYDITRNEIGGNEIGRFNLKIMATFLGVNSELVPNINCDCFLDASKKYAIIYANMGNGIILYWFAKINDEDNYKTDEAYYRLFYWILAGKYISEFGKYINAPTGDPGSEPATEPGSEPEPEPEPEPGYDPEPGFAFEREQAEEEAWEKLREGLGIGIGVAAGTAGAVKLVRLSLPKLKELKTLLEVKWAAHSPNSGKNTVSGPIATAIPIVYQLINPLIANATNDEYVEVESSSELFDNLDEILLYLNPEDPNAINEYFYIEEKAVSNDDIKGESSNYEKAGNANPPRDPLIIHFTNTSEIEFTTLDDGVNFDLDKNGFAEKTAWTKNNDGFLAIDLNGNGIIDDGGELFGDNFIMPDGRISSTGFEALISLDEDDNKKIDENDSVFEELFVWFDTENKGFTDNNELKRLTELGVSYIDLNYISDTYEQEESGTRREETSYVYFNDGSFKRISEFWFPVNSTDTTYDGELAVGNVPSIEQAIKEDETGNLLELCLLFSDENDIARKRYYLKQILYFVTDSADIDINSRGGNIDARDLHVIETFMGREFEGVDGANPNINAANILCEIYSNIENIYYNHLNLKLSFGGYSTTIYEYTDESGNNDLDRSLIDCVIESMIDEEDAYSDVLLYDLGVYLKLYDKKNGTNEFAEYCNYYSEKSQSCADIVEITKNANLFIGSENSDKYTGASNINLIFGEDGDDSLYGLNGNDHFYGGYGDDILNGGQGDDNYHVELFHENDVIFDTNGDNKIVFSDYYRIDDYDISISVNGGFILTNKYTDETISLPDFLTNPINYDFIFNGETQTLGGGESREVIEGTAEDNYLEAGDGFNVFYGGDGNDTLAGGANMDFMYGENGDDLLLGRNGINVLFGGTGSDTIYDGDNGSYLNGGDGDDSLYGGGGADVLDGGAGNDYLQADHGNDTYVFGKGYDTDTINASSDLNTVIIHGYRSTDMINTRNAHNDLIINFKNSDDCLIIDHFFDYNSNRDFNFVFDNGTVLGQYDITAKYAPIDGTDADEWLAIQNSDDGIIHGNGGNDGVSGGSGNDELYGDSGDDTLYGNDGNDILDGGTGTDGLNGGNGTDTYIFAKGYGNDTINEWGSDHSIIKLTDINSDEVTVTDQYGSNLLLSIIDTEDTLVISNFKWGQATYTFEFADGAVATVNKDTWVFEFSQLPIVPEEEEVTTSDTTTTVIDETTVETEVSLEITEDEEVQSTEESNAAIETENTDSEVIVETENTTTNDLVDESDSTETEEVTEQTDSQEVDSAENVSEDITEETSSNIIDETEASVKTDMTE